MARGMFCERDGDVLKQLFSWYCSLRERAELRRLAEMLNSARFDDLSGRFNHRLSEAEYVNRIKAAAKRFDYWEGVPRDYADGARWIRRAAEEGKYVSLSFLAGAINAAEEDFKRGLRKSAEQGCVDAQVILGEVCLCEGFNGKQWRLLGKGSRYLEALMWFGVAALQGDAEAQLCLGFMYAKDPGYGAKDTGIPKNLVEAAHWYRKSAEQGNAWAQRALGHAYEYGLGVPQDLARAVEWYQKAAEDWMGRPGGGLGKDDLERLQQHLIRDQSSVVR